MLSANGEICLKEGAGFFHLNKGDALNFSEKKDKNVLHHLWSPCYTFFLNTLSDWDEKKTA